jgi:hypothetical protein
VYGIQLSHYIAQWWVLMISVLNHCVHNRRGPFCISLHNILMRDAATWSYLITYYFNSKRSRDSSIGIVRGYRLDGPGSIPGRFFSSAQCLPPPPQPPIQWVPEVLSEGKATEARS